MSKFTQKEFETLVDVQQRYFPGNVMKLGGNDKTLFDTLAEVDAKFASKIQETVGGMNAAVALMNPVTRDLVKDKYVGDDYYLFTLEIGEDKVYSLNKIESHIYFDSDEPTPLTFDEVKEAGFDVDIFRINDAN